MASPARKSEPVMRTVSGNSSDSARASESFVTECDCLSARDANVSGDSDRGDWMAVKMNRSAIRSSAGKVSDSCLSLAHPKMMVALVDPNCCLQVSTRAAMEAMLWAPSITYRVPMRWKRPIHMVF